MFCKFHISIIDKQKIKILIYYDNTKIKVPHWFKEWKESLFIDSNFKTFIWVIKWSIVKCHKRNLTAVLHFISISWARVFSYCKFQCLFTQCKVRKMHFFTTKIRICSFLIIVLLLPGCIKMPINALLISYPIYTNTKFSSFTICEIYVLVQ